MISPILAAHDADTIALQLGIFIARQSYHYRVSPSAVVAAIRDALPSQPEGSSSPHAPAAQTDEEASPQAAPSVAPIPGAPKPLPDAPDNPADALSQPAEAKTSEQVDGGAVSAVKGANARLENAEGVEPPPSTPPRQTKRQQVIDCHEANPDWNSFQIAEHLGFGAAHVQVIAGQCGIKLPPAPRPEQPNMRDKVIAVVEANPGLTTRQIAAAAGCSLGTAARWAKEAREKAQPPEELPPLSKPSDRLPLPPPVVRPVRREPSGRFYLREKAEIGKPVRYVHQSLSACPTGPGPLMTLDRKWAWFDTMERYRGALVKWPQITSMIKEAANG